MATSGVTYGDLQQLLLSLGFVEESVEASHRAFRHRASDTVIVLAYGYDSTTPVRNEDLLSVRRHLHEKGLASARALAALRAKRARNVKSAEDRDSRK
jgi:predicted RNA binding protein YcfA (HicA-like mRNA interferase family)